MVKCDISFILTTEGWFYEATIMNLSGSKIIGIFMSNCIKRDLILAALEEAHEAIGRVGDA